MVQPSFYHKIAKIGGWPGLVVCRHGGFARAGVMSWRWEKMMGEFLKEVKRISTMIVRMDRGRIMIYPE